MGILFLFFQLPSKEQKLFIAVEAGKMNRVKDLIDSGVDINSRTAKGRTPLLLAISARKADVVIFLMQRGADPNIKDNRGISPYELALTNGLTNVAEMIQKNTKSKSVN